MNGARVTDMVFFRVCEILTFTYHYRFERRRGPTSLPASASSLRSGLLISQNPCRFAMRMATPRQMWRFRGSMPAVLNLMIGNVGAQRSGVKNFHCMKGDADRLRRGSSCRAW